MLYLPFILYGLSFMYLFYGVNDVTNIGVLENTRIVVHSNSFYTSDLKNTRIDFTREDWYTQFLAIRKIIAKNRNDVNNEEIERMLRMDDGYSIANFTNTYSIVTNVCVDFEKPPNCSLMFHERRNNLIVEQARPYYNMDTFYMYDLKDIHSDNKTANISSFHNILLIKFRWEKNIYHTLEGFSSLFYYAMHPEAFPTIKYILMIRHGDYSLNSWTSILEDLLPSLFDSSIRPVIKYAPLIRFCEKAIVLGGSWQPYGYGSFVPEPVLADMIRALVYKYTNWEYRTPSDNKLSVFFLKRGGRRSIVNSDSIYYGLKERYNNSIHLNYNRLDDMSGRDQMKLFSYLDILIGPHGAGSTNSIFMFPRSAVIEIFPPHFYYDCYEKLSIGIDIRYEKIIALGSLPECKRQDCSKQELRDRHFNVSIEEIESVLEDTVKVVWKEKYKMAQRE